MSWGAERDHVLPVLDLGVEHAQRVGLHPGEELLTEPAPLPHEVLPQGGHVRGPAGGVTHRVEQEPQPGQPEVAVEPGEQDDDLHVDRGVGDPQRLDPELPVLAVPTLLRALVPEVGGEVPDLPRRGRPVLHVGPDHRRGALGAQREPAAALVGELVHLLRDDVGVLADPLEHLEVLEHRGDREAVSVPVRALGEARHDLGPSTGFGRQDVMDPLGGAEVVGHRRRAYVSPSPPLGSFGARSGRGEAGGAAGGQTREAP